MRSLIRFVFLFLAASLPAGSAAWRERSLATLTCDTLIEEQVVGRGGALRLPGGPLAALAFALQRCALRGHPLVSGDLVSTGATTGIHALRPGQQACVRFDGIGELRCRAVPASGLHGAPA